MSSSVLLKPEGDVREFGHAFNKGGVRAVVVTTGTGRLPETLAALAAQTYRDLAVTVVDASMHDADDHSAGAEIDATASRFHASVIAAPREAHFAQAANVMLSDTSLDSEWVLFLHDEVALDPSAVETLIEGAEAAGAQIAAPKICDWENPNVLREVGMGADRFGFPYTSVEVGEVDHGQHDKDRTTLYVTTTAMLINTGLLRQLGGFDPRLGSIEHDLDLCWRARLLGAKIAVIPSATAYHAPGELDIGQVQYPRIVAQRNRLRVVLKCYSISTLPVVFFQLAMLNLLEMVLLATSGRGRRARAILGAWISNFWHIGELLKARRRLQGMRVVSDSEIRTLQFSDSARVRAYIDNRLRAVDDGAVPSTLQASGTGVWEFAIHEITRPQVLFWVTLLCLFVVGGRKLVYDPNLPLVGEAVPIPDTATLWRDYFSAWQSYGFGSAAPPSPSGFLLGIVQWFFPAWGTAKVMAGSYLVGLIGIWRVAGRLGKWQGQATSVVLYGLSPVSLGAMSRGSTGTMVFFGLAPFMLNKIVSHFTGRVGMAAAVRRVLGMAALMAVSSAFFPPAIPVVVSMAVVITVTSIISSRLAASLASLVSTCLSAAIAFGLLWPWSWLLVGSDTPLNAAWRGWDGARFQIGAVGVLRMQLGPAGKMPWGMLFAALALAALFVVKGERLSWAVRFWGVALASMAPIWLAGQEIIDPALPIAFGILVPAAMSLALSGGLGAAELAEMQERGKVLQVGIAGVLVVAAVLLAPSLWTFLNGRLGLGDNEYRRAIEEPASQADQSFKLLWIGAQQDLPGYALSLPKGHGAGAYSLSGPAGPVWGDLEPQVPGAGSGRLGEVLREIASEGSTRGGRSLATLGIRYVVLPAGREEQVTGPSGTLPPPDELVSGLRRQLDIKEIQAVPGVTLFEVSPDSRLDNMVVGGPSIVEAARATESVGAEQRAFEELLLAADFKQLKPLPGDRHLSFDKAINATEGEGLILAQEFDERWSLVNGEGVVLPTTHEESFGWSNMFVFGADYAGRARLEFRDGGVRRQELMIQAESVLVFLLVAVLARNRDFDEDAARPERRAAVE